MGRTKVTLVAAECVVCHGPFTKAPSNHRICCSPQCTNQRRTEYERNRSKTRKRASRGSRKAPAITKNMIERYASRTVKRGIERELAQQLKREISKLLKAPLNARI